MGILSSPRRVAKSCARAEDSATGQNGVAQGSENVAGGAQPPPPPGLGRAGSRRGADQGEPLRGENHEG
jgi:hypothetical protein